MESRAAAVRPLCAGGFSLIELLVCVAVVALLGGLAMPGLQGAWLRARRSEAVQALLQVQLAEERFFAVHGRYAADLPELQGATGAMPELRHYRLAASSADADQYQLEAQATGSQSGDRAECLWLRVNQRGERSPPGTSVCWR